MQRFRSIPTGIGATDDAIDLADRLEVLCRAMVRARYADRNISLCLAIEEMAIEAGRGWRILMVVAELLADAARPACDGEGGAVLVEAFVRDQAVICRIRGNGYGWTDGSMSYGSSVVRMLVREMRGYLTVVSSSAGTEVELTVPLLG